METGIFIQLRMGTGLGRGIFPRAGKRGRGRGKIDPRPHPCSGNELDPYPVLIPIGDGDFSPMRGGAPTHYHPYVYESPLPQKKACLLDA